MADPHRPPPMTGVLETVLYFADQDRAEAFYTDVLGMHLMDREPKRSLFYRAGKSVFLLFQRDLTLTSERVPPHGATGSVHTCFRVAPEEYERWKTHLAEHGVEMIKEVEWKRGRTFYFHDPDGNLLEIANADIWPS